jgi:hypothetical protein
MLAQAFGSGHIYGNLLGFFKYLQALSVTNQHARRPSYPRQLTFRSEVKEFQDFRRAIGGRL